MFNYQKIKWLENKIQEYKYYNDRMEVVLRKISYRVKAPQGYDALQQMESYLEREEASDAAKAEREKIEKIVLDLLARQKGKK
jgi:hypothetical protein